MPFNPVKPHRAAALAELDALREEFRARMSTSRRPQIFASRTGVVLSGGGARGAYEAGVLMAFQDAQVPTHIITATSVGSINAASYAAEADGFIGKAEPLINAWLELTPATLGIDWSRYIFLLAGLIAASAGIGNFLWLWMQQHGIFLHAHHPKFTWFALAVAGISILLFADKLSYVAYVIIKFARKRDWEPDWRKTWVSLGANVLVWGFLILFLGFTYIHLPLQGGLHFDIATHVPVLAALLVALGIYRLLQDPLSKLSHRFLRLPLRTGLFPNFDRIKFLRARIPADKLRNSAIRVIMTATDIQRGTARFFSNVPVETLLADPGAQEEFVRKEVEQPQDLVLAAVASSSYTFAYEAVNMEGRLWTDGGIMTNQPVLPALRLGADVLFLVLIAPLEGEDQTGKIKTFLDVGVTAVDILVSKNFKSDIALLSNINRLCSIYANEMGVKPEQLELEVGKQRYRFVKFFNIAPEKPLPAGALDFESEVVGPIIIQGYRDAGRVIQQFLDYEASRPARESRRMVRLAAERPEGNFRVTRH
ncbi:MAG TPA: patatin-like phospholipase family protein [Candidatus Angelobacter sp.]|nr:patatin-like phospholipase family protein [Candidatus Angelobacter sp.]